jgi:ubiquinone/menaquinone biosynthesis C-methylase UbiE
LKNSSKDIAKVFDQHANIYVDKYFSVEYYQDALNVFYTHSNPEGHYLDMACGPGNLTSHLLAHLPNAKALGIDIAEEMLTLAKKLNPNAEFDNIDCTDLSSIDQKFDGILSGFVLPYMNNKEVQKLVAQCADLLNSNGVIFLSGNLADYNHSVKQGASNGEGPELYSFYYSQEFLEGELIKNGFDIVSALNYSRNYDDFEVNEIVLVAIKT